MTTQETKVAKFVRTGRSRALVNLSKMGHCAPAVMQTILDGSNMGSARLVRLVGGLPGGIGNTGQECGAITSPLVVLGLRYASDHMRQGVPMIVYKGHDFLRRFTGSFRTPLCGVIRGTGRVPFTCINVIRRAPELFEETLASSCEDALSDGQIEAYARLHAHFTGTGFRRGFHCSHDVLDRLRGSISVDQQLLDATAGFLGGTILSGMTCGAFTAGVMALGLALGRIENSRLRVLRLIGTMTMGGNALADNLNAFSCTMNRGHRLGEWFASRFGSTLCREITECDFSITGDVQRFIEKGGVARCREITQGVAREVQAMIRSGLEQEAI